MEEELRRKLVSRVNEADGAALLHALDAIVHQDTAVAGMTGEICVAVRGSQGYRFWRCRLGGSTECCFVGEWPRTSDATLFLSAFAADAILLTGRIPAGEMMVFDGDRALMRRFVGRYCCESSGWLEIQTS